MCGGVRIIAARSPWVVFSGADGGGDPRRRQPLPFGEPHNLTARLSQILVNVCAEGLERRHAQDAHPSGSGAVNSSRVSSSSAVRNAARVFPDPVGAAMSMPAGKNRFPSASLSGRRLTERG
jgi:hypothetical protein